MVCDHQVCTTLDEVHEVFNALVSQNSKEQLMIVMLVIVFMRDPLLRARKDYGSLIMTLEQAHKELAKERRLRRGKNSYQSLSSGLQRKG